VVDWDGLENRSRCKPTVGSNPTPSAVLNHRALPRMIGARATSFFATNPQSCDCGGAMS
jgi:hypothetical protein